MKVLEKIIIEEKEYICIQKLSIKGNIIYMCQEQNTKKVIYLKENKDNGKLEKTEDKDIRKEVEKLIYAKSLDYVYENK